MKNLVRVAIHKEYQLEVEAESADLAMLSVPQLSIHDIEAKGVLVDERADAYDAVELEEA